MLQSKSGDRETRPEWQAWARDWALPPGCRSPSGSSNHAQKAITLVIPCR